MEGHGSVLLHSMLQRLKLQTNNENETQSQEVQQSPFRQDNHITAGTPTETPVFRFNGYLDTNHNVNGLSTNSTLLDTPLTLHSPGLKDEVKPLFKQPDKETGIFASPAPRPQRWGFLNNYSKRSYDISSLTDNSWASKWQWKQKPKKMTNSPSVSSLQSIDTSIPASATLGNQDQGHVANDGGMGQKKWTQKAKERWKDWHKSLEKRVLKDDQVANSIPSSNFSQTLSVENHTASTALRMDMGFQHQPINNGIEESPLSSPDHLSEPISSLGPINLMEEIFTGPEWAKFLSPDINRHSVSNCNFQEQAMQTPSLFSQSSQQEQTLLRQSDYEDPNFQSQMNSGGQSMDTTQCAVTQRNYFDLSLSPSNRLHQDQNELSDSGSNQLESMDLCVSPTKINEPTKEPSDYNPYNQSLSTEWHAHQPLSSKHIPIQSQGSELHQAQPENGHVEMLHVTDLSYLQSNHIALLKKEISLSRKRRNCPERRGLSEQSRPEIGDIQEWSSNATSENLALSPSALSSSSSLQYSISQDSSASTETVIKKRRVENMRKVRFAEEVIFLPPLILCDVEDEDEDDDNDISEYNKDDEDCQEEPSPGPSVPRWIAALRNKSKTTKLKLPHISSSRFRTRKKINFVS